VSKVALLKIVTTITYFSLAIAACKNLNSNVKNDETPPDEKTYPLVFQEDLEPDLVPYFNSLRDGSPVTLRELEKAATAMNELISRAMEYRNIPAGAGPSIVRNMEKPGYNKDANKFIYRGIRHGTRTFIYKLTDQPDFEKIDKWYVHSWFANSILNDPSSGKYTALNEQVEHVLDTKIYEKATAAKRIELMDDVDLALHFLPGYSGAKKAVYGKGGDRILGTIEAIGDLASLGLGSKIKVIQKGAALITLSAATTRITAANIKIANGTATMATGIDVFIGVVEASISAFTLVKIKASSSLGRAWVDNLDEAERLGRQLNRSGDDILKKGLSEDEFLKLTGKRLRADGPGVNNVINASEDAFKVIKGERYLNLKKIFSNFNEEIFIGIEKGHAYLIVAGKRVDAGILRKIKVKSIKSGSTKPGLIARLDLDAATKAKVIEGVKTATTNRALTCARGVCKTLSKHGDIVSGKGGLIDTTKPTDLFTNILNGRLKYGTGPNTGKIIKVDLIFGEPVSVGEIIKKSAWLEYTVAAGTPIYTSTMHAIVDLTFGLVQKSNESGDTEDEVIMLMSEE